MIAQTQIFERLYLEVREKEHRVYSDEQVKLLPQISPNKAQEKEWILRSKTVNRFLSYIDGREIKTVLDLGCGNGWFSNQMALKLTSAEVTGIDINQTELNQAIRCFGSENVNFEYLDIFEMSTNKKFDLITINAAIQYFENVARLLEKIKTLLSDNGEFHVLDSPIYQDKKSASEAKTRSINYYDRIGNSELNQWYFHHTWDDFKSFKTLYKPMSNRVLSKIKPDSPFPWIVYRQNG